MPVDTPTKRQQQVLDYMHEYHATWRMWPSVRDLCEKFKMKSTEGMMGHLRALKKKGYVTNKPGVARSWRPQKRSYEITCPDCGCAIEVSEESS